MKINFNQSPTAFETNGLAVHYAPSKRNVPTWRWRVLVLLVLAPLLLFLGRVVYGAIFASMPGFVTVDHSLVKTPLAGRLVHSADQGAKVQAGDVVAELRNELFESQRTALQAALALAQGREREETAAAGAARVIPANATAQPMLALRQAQYRKLRELVDMRAATQAELDEAYGALIQARRESAGTPVRAALAAAAAPAAAEVRALSERLAEVSARINTLRLLAPRDGTVAQVFPKPGEWLAENTEILDVRAERAPTVEVYVDPSSAPAASVGQWATIHFLDGYTHRARVAEVKATAQRLPADRANPLVVRHHSIIAMLEPSPALPNRYRINILPVDVRFDLFHSDKKGSTWLSAFQNEKGNM